MKCIWCKEVTLRKDLIVHTCHSCVEHMIRMDLFIRNEEKKEVKE